MKKIGFLLILFFAILSCSSESEMTSTTPETTTDEYKLLTINTSGELYEIGNNTGTTIKIGQIPTYSNLLMLQSVCNLNSKILAIEAIAFSPNIIYVYDKNSGSTNSVTINLPASVTTNMNEPFLSAMTYDGSRILAVVGENMPNSTHPSKIVSINPDTYQVTDLEIAFYQQSVLSMLYTNNKLYMGTRNHGFLEVDVLEKTVTVKANIAITRLTKQNETNIACMQLIPGGVINGVKPITFDLQNDVYAEKSTDTVIGLGNVTGNTIFHNNEYLTILFKPNGVFGLQKMNYTTNVTNFIPLNYNVLGANATIIGKNSI